MHGISKLTWHNGDLRATEDISPSISSVSLHLGLGVFDGMMAYRRADGLHLFRAEDHLKRFVNGCKRMDFRLRWNEADLYDAIISLLAGLGAGNFYIRPIGYRGAPQIFLTGTENEPVDVSIFAVPVEVGDRTERRCAISHVRRTPPSSIPVEWKICGSYANSYLARREVEGRGYDDAVLLDQEGNISEASAANLFFVRGGELWTPALNGSVFPGITRRAVIDLAADLGLRVSETVLTMRDLSTFDAAFMSSTLLELRPISWIGDYSFSRWNDVYRAIEARFGELTSGAGAPIPSEDVPIRTSAC